MIGSPNVARRHAIAAGLCLVYAAYTGNNAPLLLTSLFAFATSIWSARGAWTPQGSFGLANAITTVRLVLAVFVGVLPAESCIPAAGVAIGLFFTLDGVDGWAAKRYGTASEFGAAYDTEVDALMVSVATLAAVRADLLGPWILVVAGLRYAFVVFASVRVGRPEPPRRSGRWAFSLLMCGLSGALWLPNALTVLALALGCASVIVSFGRSFWWSLTAGRDRLA